MANEKTSSTSAANDKTMTVAGATAVAEAVKRVADAAVAAAAGAPTSAVVPELVFTGAANGGFVIRGEGLGTNGTVTVNGIPAKTNGWGATRIEGVMPQGVTSGEVVVHIDDKTSKRASFKSLGV